MVKIRQFHILRGQRYLLRTWFSLLLSHKMHFFNYRRCKFGIGRPVVRYVPLQGAGLQRGGGGHATHEHPRRRPQSL